MSLQASSSAGRRGARLLGALLLLLPGLGVAQGLRGFPAYAKVISVDHVPGELQDTARVCYEVATTIPVLDEQEFLRRQMNGALRNATPVNQDGKLVTEPQPAGVEYAPLIEYLASERGIVILETVTVGDVVNILRQVRDGQCSGGTDS